VRQVAGHLAGIRHYREGEFGNQRPYPTLTSLALSSRDLRLLFLRVESPRRRDRGCLRAVLPQVHARSRARAPGAHPYHRRVSGQPHSRPRAVLHPCR
jgi:hypothetical protein